MTMALPIPAASLESSLLANLPDGLRGELLAAYREITTNYREGRWEPSELNGGKLCEIVYSILRGYIDGHYPATASKPGNMVDACRALEMEPGSIPRSARIQIPRMLVALYEIRNNRGVGHAGGDIDPNHMDATCVLYMSKWIVAELVRFFHDVDTSTAEKAIDAIVERILPAVWKVADKYRVLDTDTNMKEKTLLLLYQSSGPLLDQILFEWVEHSNLSVYRRDVLRPLHRDKLVEYDEDTSLVHLSPTGSSLVEDEILPKVRSAA
jgi:hypothetical protein